MSLEKAILKEWKEHKNNFDKHGDWFECDIIEGIAMCNYSVGCSITSTKNGKEKTIVLKTKKQAEKYGKKERKKYYSHCDICKRFGRLLKIAKKEVQEK